MQTNAHALFYFNHINRKMKANIDQATLNHSSVYSPLLLIIRDRELKCVVDFRAQLDSPELYLTAPTHCSRDYSRRSAVKYAIEIITHGS